MTGPAVIAMTALLALGGAPERLRASVDAPRPAPSPSAIRRVDVSVAQDGLSRALSDAGVASAALDAALLTRVDVYVAAGNGRSLTVWLAEDGDLVGAQVHVGQAPLVAALYSGPLAPTGFYDERGLSLSGPLRSRPVELSRVTSTFGQRFDPINGASRVHRGVDYAVPIGSEVLAAGLGRVKARGSSAAAGNFIKLAHAGGFESWYLHLDRFGEGTEVGALVTQNQVIARSGNTGRSTGPHVHYELHLAGEALDPQRTMPIPDVALGPLALRQHRAFIKQLKAMEATR